MTRELLRKKNKEHIIFLYIFFMNKLILIYGNVYIFFQIFSEMCYTFLFMLPYYFSICLYLMIINLVILN